MMQPREDEIEDEWDAAQSDVDAGIDRYPGMSYAQGVAAALAWILGNDDAPPYSEEE